MAKTRSFIVGNSRELAHINQLLEAPIFMDTNYDYATLCEQLATELVERHARTDSDILYVLTDFLTELEEETMLKSKLDIREVVKYHMRIEEALMYFLGYLDLIGQRPIRNDIHVTAGTSTTPLKIVVFPERV